MWFLEEEITHEDAVVAHLVGKHPSKPGIWKEAFVYRNYRVR